MNYGIVVPCYNESSRLSKASFKEFINSHKDYHFCFVNDGSKDNTLDLLKQLKEECSNEISILNFPEKRGKSSAILEGIQFLYSVPSFEQIGFLDADLSVSFDEYKEMNQLLECNTSYSIIFGSRERNSERGFFRDFVSQIGKRIIRFTFRLPFQEARCKAKIFRRDAIPVVFHKEFVSKWLFNVEIFVRFINNYQLGYRPVRRILEYELKHRKGFKEPRLNLIDFILVPRDVFKIYFGYHSKF
ncbi:glycosyltransferase [Leptobacterium flavescens]|uniref:Glycosyltransferase n=1 Tax=Leptobacterium flavescens TaxID=472055 RepID=A0A6P0UHL3_9FLAO|nr:glycosyltransferase [Leptobacterium flavescens]NER12765.1 glycosyltransferase [Leptobacterium flavescens]